MAVVRGILVPHPPILMPQVGRGEEQKLAATTQAYRQAAQFAAQAKPDTLVVLSPHAEMYADWFHISPGSGASGSLARFGAPQVRLSVKYDEPFAAALCAAAAQENFPAGTEGERDPELDHASLIPLSFLREAFGGTLPNVVRIGLSGFGPLEHYRLGMLISRCAQQLDRRVCVVASGDLSHRLKADGPYGYAPEGPQYDERVLRLAQDADFGALFDFPQQLCDKAGECGHRSLVILAGCCEGRAVQARKLSYEGPFGVGYGVCLFEIGGQDASRCFYEKEKARRAEQLGRRRNEDAVAALARRCVEEYVRTGRPAVLTEALVRGVPAGRAGVFVSLHLNGRLRGCIGTINPAERDIAHEIAENSISACSRDPRFPPVTAQELAGLEYSVDILEPPEPAEDAAQLDPQRYGVIVRRGARCGLLLPRLDGVDTAEQQISIARQKAGIGPEEPVQLQRFEVTRHV